MTNVTPQAIAAFNEAVRALGKVADQLPANYETPCDLAGQLMECALSNTALTAEDVAEMLEE